MPRTATVYCHNVHDITVAESILQAEEIGTVRDEWCKTRAV